MSGPQPVTRHASQMISVMKPGMPGELLVENAPADLRPFVHPQDRPRDSWRGGRIEHGVPRIEAAMKAVCR